MKQLLSFIVFFLFFVCFAGKSEAVYDPLGVPNNKIGIHILFPDELDKARELVNTNGGEWGYVTIPIQGGDRDLAKWQNFMDNCKKLKLIPLVRLATQGDYFETASWSKPTEADIVDSANFLNSLEWPVKNRYIIVFNEVNRGDEWQGKAEPSEYAQILSYTTTVFKSKNQDFFIISSGMDNAAATDGTNYSQYDYFRLMDDAVPGIFNQIDGYSSHSYPNPAFSQPPGVNTPRSIYSFQYELNLIESMSNKKLPVFITETGWTRENFSDKQIGDFFKTAIEKPWNHEQIVAITPFLLRSGPGPFQKFSLIEESGDKNDIFRAIESLPKTKGKPVVNKNIRVLGSHEEKNLPLKDFSDNKESREGKLLKNVVKWLILTP